MRSGPLTTALLTLMLMACEGAAMRSMRDAEAQRTKEVAQMASDAAAKPMSAAGFEGKVEADASEVGSGSFSVARDPAVLPTMLIRTGQASIELDSLDIGVAQLRQLALRYGGYVANSTYQGGKEQLRSATLEIRVASERFDELVGSLGPIGRVEYVNISAQDVGEEYADIAARVTNGKKLEQRLIDLLATRTGKLQDVLEVERELARVREEIERYEGRMRYLRTRASVSTLSVAIHQPIPVTGGYRGSNVLVQAVERAWRNFVELVAACIASLGVLLPLGATAWVGASLIRRWWRRRGEAVAVAG